MVPYYGTFGAATIYFNSKLHGELWNYTPILKRQQALVQATQDIDNLSFQGEKIEGQILEFPRIPNSTVPLEVEQATYEIALAYLKGVEPDTELANLYVKSRVFGSVKTDYDYASVPEHIRAGIPSYLAWNLLNKFLKPGINLPIRRGS